MGYYLYIGGVYALVLVVAFWRSQRLKLDTRHALNLVLLSMIFGLIGSRLLHIFYEAPEIYREDPMQALRLWEGGYVFFGGAFLAFAACLLYLRAQGLPVETWLDFSAPLIALGYGLGRGACLIAGCCYGRACELPWSIEHRHPTQAYAMLTELTLLGFLVGFEKRQKQKHKTSPGLIFSLWLVGHAVGRLLMESFRDDDRGPNLGPLSISSFLSLVLLAAGLYRIWKKAPYHRPA